MLITMASIYLACGEVYWRQLLRRAATADELALSAADVMRADLAAILAAATLRAAFLVLWPLVMAWGWASARCN